MTQKLVRWLSAVRAAGVLLVAVAFALVSAVNGAAAGAAGTDAGSLASEAAWARLEAIARDRGAARDGSSGWSEVLASLVAAHPHSEASGTLAWLHLFGVPDERGSLDPPGGCPRNVDRAVAVAREGASLRSPTCSRCYSLLALMLSIGYPPLVNVAHATRDIAGRPSLIFVSHEVTAHPHGSAQAAQLPRDIGRPDPVATAYVIAMHAGDTLGILAVAHLANHGIIDAAEFGAPFPNQASAGTPRRPSAGKRATCDPFVTALLGELAGNAVDAVQTNETWGPPPQPLAAENTQQKDKSWLHHVLTNPREADPADIAEVADLLETGGSVGHEHLEIYSW